MKKANSEIVLWLHFAAVLAVIATACCWNLIPVSYLGEEFHFQMFFGIILSIFLLWVAKWFIDIPPQ